MTKLSTRLNVSPVPPDEIFALNHTFSVDPHPQKVSLGAGVYRTDDGKPWPLPVVQKAEKELVAADDLFRHEYTAIEGDVTFLGLARDLMFGFEGRDSEEQAKQRIASVQAIAGTGANHLGALFLSHHMKPGNVWLSNPSWANHWNIWELAGIPRKTYPYYKASTRSFDFDGMMSTIGK